MKTLVRTPDPVPDPQRQAAYARIARALRAALRLGGRKA